MIVSLVDGRRIAVPLAWFLCLAAASRAQLENWELIGDGEGIRWPELDEDISVAGLLHVERQREECGPSVTTASCPDLLIA